MEPAAGEAAGQSNYACQVSEIRRRSAVNQMTQQWARKINDRSVGNEVRTTQGMYGRPSCGLSEGIQRDVADMKRF